MIRNPMRQCGRQYATEAEALRSKAARNPGVLVELCWAGGHFHITTPPCITASRTGESPAAESRVSPKLKIAAKGNGSSSGKLTPPAPGEFTAKVRLAVRKRAGRGDEFEALCEAHGGWLGKDSGEFQHRDARGMGGSKDPVVNSAANAALICHECHVLAEARDTDMHGMGFWLEEGEDPRTTGIMLHGAGRGGLTLYLAEDGLGPDGTGYLHQAPVLAVTS